MGRGDRPEHQAPPEIFYNEEEAHKYTHNSRIIGIQAALTKRALELLALPPGPSQGGTPRLVLDLGCGSGLSGAELSDEGHVWVGMDISEAMLDVALDRECEGGLLLGDLGHGVPLRAGTFDGAVSISAVQWLCNADKSSHEPRKRLRRFFETLYACLARGARAVLQVYPENPAQAEMMVSAAMRAGFSGGLVVDYPHSTKAKKHFLVLMVGTTSALPQARGLDGTGQERDEDVWMGRDDEEEEEEDGEEDGEEGGQVKVGGRERRKVKAKRGTGGSSKKSGGSGGKAAKGSRAWVLAKKEGNRKRGHEQVPLDTKYTGRRRKRLGL